MRSTVRTPRLVVRCDASPQLGAGHLTRCRSLSLALRPLGVQVLFAVRERPASTRAAVGEDGWETVPVPAETPMSRFDLEATLDAARRFGAAGVLVDHYEAASSYFEGVRQAGLLVAVIDDCADRDLSAVDWLLNQNVAASELAYRIAPAGQLLTGPAYALLRPEFSAARGRRTRSFSAEDNKILVTFGAGDTAEPAAIVAGALDRVTQPLEVRIVLGPEAPGARDLQRLADRSRHRMDVLVGVRDMAEHMLWADLSVNAGGSTCWELMCLGLPMIVAALSEDQRSNALALGRAAIALEVPEGALDAVDIMTADLLCHPERRALMSERATAAVDGHGAVRAAASLAAALERKAARACA